MNVLDLTRVARALGTVAGAPSDWERNLVFTPSRAQVSEWLEQAQQADEHRRPDFSTPYPDAGTIPRVFDSEGDGALAELPEPVQPRDVDTLTNILEYAERCDIPQIL